MLSLQPIRTAQTGKILFAVIWNIFIGAAISLLIRNWKDNPNYVAGGVLLLFAIPGILMLLSTIQRILLIFGPRLEMKVHGYRLEPGERIELSWTLSKSHLLHGIEISLKQGLNFASVYVSQESSVQPRGMAGVEIPSGRPSNEPVVIHFVGHVKLFPNLDKEYTVLRQ